MLEPPRALWQGDLVAAGVVGPLILVHGGQREDKKAYNKIKGGHCLLRARATC